MWEITGNGLKKPSYLFGTMHASSKMVFHLSDSFYNAIKSCDAVSLELNPQTWQPEMFRMDDAQRAIKLYTRAEESSYINEKSFKLSDYDDRLKRALNEEPTQINGLLYRTFRPHADFEENTYLDLYIYQTGRKLGKQAAGVEDYFETEKLILEAYQDMAKEKKKKKRDTDGESYYDIEKKLQDAYRRGDLDLLDSLNQLTVTSDAFNEKFLYKRNEIQAHSIDSILKKQSLFVGVGAAHLPGNRGVIELLRKVGYKLRPMKMADRDAAEKEKIDKMKVPIVTQPLQTPDGSIQITMPGKLYYRNDSRMNESYQYADMENGTYYMITRVKTHAPLLGQTEADVMNKVDSFLYENIPGKILKKTVIAKSGYKGYDITNKTRRGDIQRYNILVTPTEVLVFKMSGNDEYVYGKEADDFFASIKVKEQQQGWLEYQPIMGGFSAPLPQVPSVTFNQHTEDGVDTWEYEAIDKTSGDAFAIWKKSLNNYQFIEEDTFDLSLMEESLKLSEVVEKEVSRKFGIKNGYPYLDMQFALKNGGSLQARAFIKGPHQYMLMARGKKRQPSFDKFINGFALTDFKYTTPSKFTDTAYHFSVNSAVRPEMDGEIRALVEKVMNESSYYNKNNEDTYVAWPAEKMAYFKNDTTGEAILVSTQSFAKYFSSRDSLKFWKSQFNTERLEKDFIVSKQFTWLNKETAGYSYTLLDTNSTRKIIGLDILKDNRIYRLATLSDNVGTESAFIKNFFASFLPDTAKVGPSVFENKLEQFFKDFYSKDTATKKVANSALSQIYYGPKGIDKIKEAIANLKLGDKDYFDLKSKFIAELGYIDDSCCASKVVGYLKQLYNQTADTSSFQNPILVALARLKTKESYALLKELLVQDPPVFTGGDVGVSDLFSNMQDTLALAKTMFPDLLQLASLDDYKDAINELLITLVDSGYMKHTDYESYYSKLYFDAKIEMKRQQNRDEKVVEKENNKEDEEDNDNNYRSNRYNRYDSHESSGIIDYAILLMPFYDTHPAVQKFFDKLLLSKDDDVRMDAAILMARHKKPVADSVFEKLAAKDQYRSRLWKGLDEIKQLSFFPKAYNTQENMARSLLLASRGLEKFFAIESVGNELVTLKGGKKGRVYFFKYKIKKDDDWQIGISGPQPENNKNVNADDDLVKLMDKKLKEDEPVLEQFEKKLKQLLLSSRKSAANFYNDREYRSLVDYDRYGD
jgi:uncharacterized protein YbaP (TraB family)